MMFFLGHPHHWDQGCGIKGFLPTSVIQGNPPVYEHNSLWKGFFRCIREVVIPHSPEIGTAQSLFRPLDQLSKTLRLGSSLAAIKR